MMKKCSISSIKNFPLLSDRALLFFVVYSHSLFFYSSPFVIPAVAGRRKPVQTPKSNAFIAFRHHTSACTCRLRCNGKASAQSLERRVVREGRSSPEKQYLYFSPHSRNNSPVKRPVSKGLNSCFCYNYRALSQSCMSTQTTLIAR